MWVILLAVHSALFLDYATLLGGIAVALLVSLIVLTSAQIIVLQKRRRGFGPGQFPAD